jgi:hypothetical protein
MTNKNTSDKGGSKRPAKSTSSSVRQGMPPSEQAAKAISGKAGDKPPIESTSAIQRRNPWVTVLIVLVIIALLCICVFGVALWYTGDSIMQFLLENGLIQ